MKYLSIALLLIVLIGCTHVGQRDPKSDVDALGQKTTDGQVQQMILAGESERRARVKALVEKLADASIEKRQAAFVELRDKFVRNRDIPDLNMEIARNADPEVVRFLQNLLVFIKGKWRLPAAGWTGDGDECSRRYEEEFKKLNASVSLWVRQPGSSTTLIHVPNDVETRLGVFNLILTFEPGVVAIRKNWKDVSFLFFLTDLRVLDLSDTQIADLTPLKGLSKLRLLDLEGTPVADLSPLNGLKRLRLLNLGNTRVTDLSSLKDLPWVSVVNLENTKVTNLSPLKNLPKLRWLDVENTPVADLSPLESLPKLWLLDLKNTRVTDLTPLKGQTELQELYLGNTRVSDLTPLKEMRSLYRLYLENTKVTDLTPLKGLPLVELYLKNTKVTDLATLNERLKNSRLYINKDEDKDSPDMTWLSDYVAVDVQE